MSKAIEVDEEQNASGERLEIESHQRLSATSRPLGCCSFHVSGGDGHEKCQILRSKGGGQQYRLTRDCLYVMYWNRDALTCTLREGEICEYFAHSDTYIFEGRESIEGALFSPYFLCSVVERWGFWFEPVQPTKSVASTAEPVAERPDCSVQHDHGSDVTNHQPDSLNEHGV